MITPLRMNTGPKSQDNAMLKNRLAKIRLKNSRGTSVFIIFVLTLGHCVFPLQHTGIFTSLYKQGVDGIIRRCLPEHEQGQILWKCHSEAYEGHHAGDRIAHKVLQSGFYWPTLFKDARKFVLSCDECRRIGNIGKRKEMPMNYSLAVEPFDVWGFDHMGAFPSSNGYTHILGAVD
mgnify:CR=1 FL=1